jgi:hypothetical protein
MTNYSIDASVYAYPFQDDNINGDGLYDYYKTIMVLHDLIIEKQARYIRYFISKRDIELIIKNEELNFIEQNASLMDQILNDSYCNINMRDAQKCLDEIFSILYNPVHDPVKGDMTKHVIFENWFDVDRISSNSYPRLPDTLSKEIHNKELRKNIIKHLLLLAALNKYVYKNCETHQLVINSSIKEQDIPMTSEFNIEMIQGSYLMDDDRPQNIIFKIKNLPLNSVKIEKQNVKVSSLDKLANDGLKYKLEEWAKAIDDAAKNFKSNISFGLEVKAV